MPRGLYRIHGMDGRPDDVRVEDDGIDIPLEEGLYRVRGYLPLVGDLPWQEDYFNKKTPAGNEGAGSDAAKEAREQARREFRARFDKP